MEIRDTMLTKELLEFTSFDKLRYVTKQLVFQKPRIFNTVSNFSPVLATRNKNGVRGIFDCLQSNFQRIKLLLLVAKNAILRRYVPFDPFLRSTRIKSPRNVRRCRDRPFTPCVSRRTTLVWPDLASTTRRRRTICGST